MARQLVCILGLDTVRHKTLYQTRWLHDQGYDIDVFTMHRDLDSRAVDTSARITLLSHSFIWRVWQVLLYLVRNRDRVHHVELYVGGRFAFIHALLAKLTGVPLLVIERGDLLLVHKRVYGWLTRTSIKLCYRLADRVWYREIYMRPLLAGLGVKKGFLLPNAVPIPAFHQNSSTRSVDFLWLNRMVPERRPDEFARAVARLARKRQLRCTVVGFSLDPPDRRVAEMERTMQEVLHDAPGCVLLPFQDPEIHYETARFFVLHGDIVFANFSLLEAMARGVVPIVSCVQGAELIVQDGENGIVYSPNEDALEEALDRALDLPEAQWRAWSTAARETVRDRYSIEAWGTSLLIEYSRLRGTADRKAM